MPLLLRTAAVASHTFPTPTPTVFSNDTLVNPLTNETIPYNNLTSGTSFAKPPPLPIFATALWNGTAGNSTLTSPPNANVTTPAFFYNITFTSWDNSSLSTSSSSYVTSYGNFDNNPSPDQGAVVVYGPGGGHLTPLGVTLVILSIVFLLGILFATFIYLRRRRRRHQQKWLPGDRIFKDGTLLSTTAGLRGIGKGHVQSSRIVVGPRQRISSLPSSPVDFFCDSYDPGAFAGVPGDDLRATPDETENPGSSPLSTLSLVKPKLPKVSIAGLLPAVLGPPSPRRKSPARTATLGEERGRIAPPPLPSISPSKMTYPPTYPPSFTPSAFHLADGIPTQPISSTPPPAWKPESPAGSIELERRRLEKVVVDYEGWGEEYHVW